MADILEKENVEQKPEIIDNESQVSPSSEDEKKQSSQKPQSKEKPMTDGELRYHLHRIEKKGGFFSTMFSTMCGIFLSMFIMGGLLFLNFIFLILCSLANTSTTVSDNSVLVLNLKGSIEEKSNKDVLGQLTSETSVKTLGLNDILCAIDKAEENPNIKGIYLETGYLETDYATVQEIRNRLEQFRKSGKWIISYSDEYYQGAYYLASVANKVYVNPQGSIDWHGIGSQPVFYKDVMAKFGVKMNVVKVGKFKSFTEQYTEDKMSDANREQVTRYISGLWDNVCSAVSKSRDISVEDLNAYADSLITYDDPNLLVKRKMVDGLLYADQVKEQVKKQLGLDNGDKISQVSINQMINTSDGNYGHGDKIAVYYCSGDIVMNETTGLVMNGEGGIVAEKVVRDLQKLADDDNVKAVVMRLNTGGGDAYASEQLWRAISILKEKKPVVVSMGGATASGGYYMSCNSSWIVAQPTTLTGSIGIFGAFPDFSGLLTEKLGVKYDEVTTNKHSTFSPVCYSRPLSPDEVSILQRTINRGYETFRKRVCDGRKMSVENVEKIAQGRVWLGQDAVKIGLVDQLGGLADAVKKAAELAKLDSYYTEDYPGDEDFFTQLLSSTHEHNILDEQMRETLGVYYEPMRFMKTLSRQSPVQARVPFELNIK